MNDQNVKKRARAAEFLKFKKNKIHFAADSECSSSFYMTDSEAEEVSDGDELLVDVNLDDDANDPLPPEEFGPEHVDGVPAAVVPKVSGRGHCWGCEESAFRHMRQLKERCSADVLAGCLTVPKSAKQSEVLKSKNPPKKSDPERGDTSKAAVPSALRQSSNVEPVPAKLPKYMMWVEKHSHYRLQVPFKNNNGERRFIARFVKPQDYGDDLAVAYHAAKQLRDDIIANPLSYYKVKKRK